MFLGQLPADLGVSDLDVLVRNGLPVISDPVVDQMAVRMGPVEMAHQEDCVSVMPIFCMYSFAIYVIRA